MPSIATLSITSGIKRALGEETVAGVRTLVGVILRQQFLCCPLEHPNELGPDHLPFRLGISHAGEQLEKTFRRIDVFEFDLKILDEDSLHRLGLVFAQQSVVNEDAGELIANRLVQKRRRHRRIDAAAQPEHDFLVAHLLADALTGFVNERAHRPIHRAMADAEEEILDDLVAARGVRHFGMKLKRVELLRGVFDRREHGILRVRDDAEAVRESSELVAMAVPDVHLLAEPVEKRECVRRCAGLRRRTRDGG